MHFKELLNAKNVEEADHESELKKKGDYERQNIWIKSKGSISYELWLDGSPREIIIIIMIEAMCHVLRVGFVSSGCTHI